MQPADYEARQRALDPGNSFAVTAPAGSGKTGLLTQRVLTLLPLCNQPEEVVCITFTRKAAAEMRERIVEAITRGANTERPEQPHEQLSWDLAQAVIARDREKNWQLLRNPNRLRIQTIDGLCRSLTQFNPVSSGIGGTTQLLEHPSTAYRQAVEMTLSDLEQEGPLREDLAALLTHLDNNLDAVSNLLIGLLAKRDQWLLPLLSARDAKDYLEGVLNEMIGESLQQVSEHLLPWESDLCLLADYAGNNCLKDKPDSDICRLAGMVGLPEDSPAALTPWRHVAELLLTQKGDWRSPRGLNKNCGFPAGTDKAGKEAAKARKEAMAALLAELSEQTGLLSALQFIRLLPPPRYHHQQWRLLDSLTRLMPHVVGQLKLVFRQLNATDFSEITQGALYALGSADEPTDLSLILDHQIRHILVDEFQDTASPQLQLLEKLTAGWQPDDGRTLFIVGDGMQSCYGFRDANVGIFLDARKAGIGDVPLQPLNLTVNFRSQTGVVDWVNHTFEQAFPESDDISRGAVCYSGSIAFKPELEGPAVQAQLFVDHPDRNAEAEAVVELAKQARIEDPQGSIAILVRSRPHLQAVIPTLQAAGLPWQATDIEPLANRMAVVDLISLTRAQLDPSDRNAWLALLRSPWIGLDHADLLVVATHIEDSGEDTRQQPLIIQQLEKSLLPAANNPFDGIISADGQAILNRAAPQLIQTWKQRSRKSLRHRIEGLWLALGGPAALFDHIDLDNARDFFALLERYDSGGRIERWQEFQLAVNQLYARPATEAGPQIQVMTIHKSKGLEFDTVIIPGLDKGQRADDKPLLIWQERINRGHQKQLLLSPLSATGDDPDPLYQFLRHEQKVKNQLESTRLLYVGCTRAIKRLHLLALVNSDNKKDGCKAPASGSLLYSLWPQLEHQAQLHRQSGEQSRTEAEEPLAYLRRLSPHWRRPVSVPGSLLAAYRGRETDDEDNQVSDEGYRHRAARHTGTVLHRCLAQIAGTDLLLWDSARIERQKDFWRVQLRELGVNGKDLPQALDRLELGLRRTLEDPAGRWILGNHRHGEAELSLWSGTTKARNLIIDRTFVDEKNQRWVVDYKSSEPSANQTLEEFLEVEVRQYQNQLRRYCQLFVQDPGPPPKAALYFPMLGRLQEVNWSDDKMP
ncbi:UvrD-helicase domain-containing protein [Pseudomaricurvus alkylphenolicus]|uniref:UvrD-helicase domain-containing protein n=1 Tax=Pseudomaricurvus alkylphenolicus TaxID=1306991 RepID=UPI001421327B|nr:UvrD-helicase domain-containing protein [Pseudomaricurvus alkylphenolicus]NIB41148.1 UvrD-helicase domain-containing protein [Pseudomaricurvus alkylphenolicus]